MLQFLGVYFEKILKDSNTPLLIRNIQMGMTSIMLALVSIYLSGVCCDTFIVIVLTFNFYYVVIYRMDFKLLSMVSSTAIIT